MWGRVELSVVIPVYNEEDNIMPLCEAVADSLEGLEYEILLVDDGSTDRTVERARAENNPRMRILVFSGNYGQTSAIAAGIAEAVGQFIVTMDGDLQNDPVDIPMMLAKLKEEELDVVVGYRAERKDPLLRKIPSKIANFLIRLTTKVEVHDYGCTLKLFRNDVAKKLDLYGELHRFIPLLSKMHGAKIAEVPVRHHVRRFGSSKYGMRRTVKVLSDLMLMLFFLKYRQRPMHLFGGLGIGMFSLGSLIAFYLFIEKLLGNDIGHRPLFYVGLLLIIMSVQFVTAGFLSELIMRTYFESQNKKPYAIARRYQGSELMDE